MPANDIRVGDISVALKYRVEGLNKVKEAQKTMLSASISTDTTIGKLKDLNKTIRNAYESAYSSANKSSEAIILANNKVTKSFISVNTALQTYKKAQKEASVASKAFKAAKESISFPKSNKFDYKIVGSEIKTRRKGDTSGQWETNIYLTTKYAKQLAALPALEKRHTDTLLNKKKAYAAFQKVSIDSANAVNNLIQKTGQEQVAQAMQNAKIETARNRESAKAWDLSFAKKLQQNEVPTLKGIVEQFKAIRKNQKEIGKETDNTNKKTKNVHRSISDIAATLYTIRRVLTMLRQLWSKVNEFIEASASWTENLNLLEVVFDDVSAGAEKTKKWVDDISNSYLMDKNAITQYVSIFKQMANAMGQASDVGEKLSETLTLIGFDIASLRNVKTETAINDLASAIAGQVKPVRKYGFDITQQSIDTLLKESGIGGSSATLTQAEKQLARTILLVRQSQDAWGDLGKTINTFSNQQRIMNDQWTTFKRLIGNALVGIVEIGDSFEEAYAKAGPATRAIWNINGALIAMNSVVRAIVPEVENFGGSVAQESDLAADSLEELEDVANSSLAPFDKFNVMSSGSGMANGFTSTRKALEELLGTETDKYGATISKRMEDIQTYSKGIAEDILKKTIPAYAEWKEIGENASKTFADFYKETNQSLETIFPWIGPLKEAWENLKPILGTFIQQIPTLLSASLNLLSGILTILNPILKIVANIVNYLATNNLIVPALITIFAILASIKITVAAIRAISAFGNMVTAVKQLLPLLATTKLYLSANILPALKMGLATVMKFSPVILGIVALGAGLSIYSQNLNKMSTTAKVLIPILSAILGLIVGIKAAAAFGPIVGAGVGLATAAAMLAGISTLAAKFQFADGGYINGGIFNAGESGPEWVGRQGSTSTIINDRQMDEIMGDAVERGVVNALNRSNYGRNGNGKIAIVNMNGKALFEVVEEQGKKVGKVFAKA